MFFGGVVVGCNNGDCAADNNDVDVGDDNNDDDGNNNDDCVYTIDENVGKCLGNSIDIMVNVKWCILFTANTIYEENNKTEETPTLCLAVQVVLYLYFVFLDIFYLMI